MTPCAVSLSDMALPQGFVQMIEGLAFPPFSNLAQTLAQTAPEVSVRFNRAKHTAVPPLADMVPWWSGGFYLPQRGAFTFDPALHQGIYYVQDAASMFIAKVAETLATGQPVKWLDACAAPGGKTTAVIDALPVGSVVVANEFVHNRAVILRENLAKWGTPEVKVCEGDTGYFSQFKSLFDIIAADVPCSGEGMMRKDPEAVAQWSPALVESCAKRQREIISNLWSALKPGGYFVYSTCTFNRTENEDMVRWIIDEYDAEPVEIPTEASWGISPGINVDFPCYRFIPGITRGEGLFMAVIRKPSQEEGARQSKSKSKYKKVTQPKANLRDWLKPDAAVELVEDKDKIIALSTSPLALEMPPELRPYVEIAVAKGRDYIPSQQLALSTILAEDKFQTVEVDRLTALQYLRCEALRLPDDTPKGITLLKYLGYPLGFVKNLGNRANNLYPYEWRIRSAVSPESLPPLPF